MRPIQEWLEELGETEKPLYTVTVEELEERIDAELRYVV